MKRLLAALLALTTLACSFASCGDSDVGADDTSGKKSHSEESDDEDDPDSEGEEEEEDEEEETTRHKRRERHNEESSDESSEDSSEDSEEPDTTETVTEDEHDVEDDDIPQDTTAAQQDPLVDKVEFTFGDDECEAAGDIVKKHFMWLDISKNKDYVFENEFVQLRFRVNDDAPDGETVIKYETDIANYKGMSVYPNTLLNSTVAVNTALQPRALLSDDIFSISGTNVSAVPGEEFSVYLSIKNNPGIVAFLVYFTYDSSVLDFIEAVPTGEFAEIASGVSSY